MAQSENRHHTRSQRSQRSADVNMRSTEESGHTLLAHNHERNTRDGQDEPFCPSCMPPTRCQSCMPSTECRSRFCHVVALAMLIGSLSCEWVVEDHVKKIAATLKQEDSTLHIDLRKLYDISLNWNAILMTFLAFAILTTVCCGLQIVIMGLNLRTSLNNKAVFQKLLVLVRLFLNDLPQSVLTVIVRFALFDAVPVLSFFGPLISLCGNCLILYVLRNTNALKCKKLIGCHVTLIIICSIMQIALIAKRH